MLLIIMLVLAGCTASQEDASKHVGERAGAEPGARALAYVAGDDPTDRRIALAQDGARENPDSLEAYVGLGALFLRRYRETGDAEHLRRADDAVNAALALDPNDGTALSISGLLAMQAHRFADARAIAERVLADDPEDTTALLLKGDAELEIGQYESALESYQRASDLRPDLRTYNRGAYMRWLHGDAQGSLELLALAIDASSGSDPESTAWCWVDLASVHWHLGNEAQVRVALERALALVPAYLPALRLRAKLERASGDSSAAIATFESVIARAETVGDLLALADLLEAEGREDDARARVARAARIGREDLRALAVYRARRGEAVDDTLRATERELLRRSDVYSIAAHALALARVGRHDEATTEIESALALGTPDVTLVLYDALVKHLAGDDDGARAALARALAENPFADPWLAAHLERVLAVSQ